MKKILPYLFVLGITPLLAPKCNQNKKAAQENQAAAQQQAPQPLVAKGFTEKTAENVKSYPDSLVVRYQRNACFGSCPVDITEVYASGLVVYTPKIYGVTEKPSMARTNAETITQLKKTANEYQYFSLEDEYDSYIPDLPGSIYYFNIDGQKKEVVVKSGNPKEISPIATALNKFIKGIESWTALPEPEGANEEK